MMPILDRAVTDGVNFGEARRRTLADHVAETVDLDVGLSGINPGRTGRPSRACNLLNFGLDCALEDDPYDLSEEGEDRNEGVKEDGGTASGSSANNDDDDPNEDECAICGDGGGVCHNI
jgi:hypothetical protein